MFVIVSFLLTLDMYKQKLWRPQKKQYKIRGVSKVERDLYGRLRHNIPPSYKCQ